MTYILSIVIPAYNEENTIASILEQINQVDLLNGVNKEIIVISDGSTDSTVRLVRNFSANNPQLKLLCCEHKVNHGKGYSIHVGIKKATGDYIIIQDADLEYNPQEFNLLLAPVLEGRADVVFGSRFRGGKPHRILFFWHSIGNRLLTFLSNAFTNLNLTDMETCYKLFRADIIKNIKLKEKRFGFEPEVTAKIARVKNIRIYEVGISYYGRTYEEGKKIMWKDGFRAIWCVLKYNLWGRVDSGECLPFQKSGRVRPLEPTMGSQANV